MQPYFFPYAGYFRLFAAADTFVILDCVQLPRPGWVHRNRFEKANGELDWLTLPLAKAPYTTRIKDLRFRADAKKSLETSLRRFPLLNHAYETGDTLVKTALHISSDDVTAHLHCLLAEVTRRLFLDKPMVRSSTLGLPPHLSGQDRVLAIVENLGGTRYVNASGGRALYDRAAFTRRGIELQFLAPYAGSMSSVLSRLLTEPPGGIADEIARETILQD